MKVTSVEQKVDCMFLVKESCKRKFVKLFFFRSQKAICGGYYVKMRP